MSCELSFILTYEEGLYYYQRCYICPFSRSELLSDKINKPMSEREVNKIYSELTITVGALATADLMMYNLSIGPYSCYDGINAIIRYTDDYSLATTGLISIMRGAPDSILNVNNPELVDENDNSITDEQPIVQ